MANAGDKDVKTSSFWTTLPGILTGVAALVTAITGLTLGLFQYGVLGSKQSGAGKPTASTEAPQAASTAASSGQAPLSNPASKPASAHKATVVITASDGTMKTAHYDARLHLRSGQAVAFDSIKSLEVVKVYAEHADVRIALVDDSVTSASLGAGSSIYGFGDENELGTFGIAVDRLKQVVFRR